MNRQSRRRLRRLMRLETLESRCLLHAGHLGVEVATHDSLSDLSDDSPMSRAGDVQLFHISMELSTDPMPVSSGNTIAAAGGALILIASIPQLNSNPGAAATLFLNFQGSNSPTWWGYSDPPNGTAIFDKDGDPTTFNDAELADIYRAFSTVSEDFAPFTVNVTTVQPAPTARFVSQVDIGHVNLPYGGLGGGNLETSTGANPSRGWSQSAYANVISHEAGHSMGLGHQSLFDSNGNFLTEYYGGDGTSSPIMGNAGTEPSVWWSSTYPGHVQDDAAILTRGTNGISYRPDDAGDSASTAKALSIAGTSVSGSGLIGRPNDVDYWRFTTSGGFVALSASVPAGINNLDVRLELRNTNNTFMAYSDLIDSFDGAININLPAGTFYLAVSAHDYRSGPGANSYPLIMGQYTINGTVPTPPDTPPTATLTRASAVTQAGGTSYTFDVKYNDDTDIDAATVQALNVFVFEPGSTSSGRATYVEKIVDQGATVVVTYRIVPPGGTWDASDNGNYEITTFAWPVTDNAGNAVPANQRLGVIAVSIANSDTSPPDAVLVSAPDLTDANAPCQIQVRYSDNTTVRVSSLDNPDIYVIGSNGFLQNPTFVGVDVNSDGTPRVATYRVRPPEGGWTTANNGTYTIGLNPSQVFDTSGNAAAWATLGNFRVNIVQADTIRPTASANSLTITQRGLATYELAVTLRDNVAVKVSTLDSSDLLIPAFSGSAAHPQFLGVDNPTDGQPRVARYLLTAPNGGWDSWNHNTVAVWLNDNQISDTSGNFVDTTNRVLTTIWIDLPETRSSLTINDVTVTEGTGNTVYAVFTVRLSAVSGQNVVVNYAVANGTATTPQDYRHTPQSLTIMAGATSGTISVAVQGDALDEPDSETFFVNLTSATNATIADNQGIGRITDNDPPPSLTISNATVTEGAGSTVNVVFMVSLSASSGQNVTVNYDTANGTAIAGSDYSATQGRLTFAPGQTSKSITVSILADARDEPTETFFVRLSNAINAVFANSQGLGTILDYRSRLRAYR